MRFLAALIPLLTFAFHAADAQDRCLGALTAEQIRTCLAPAIKTRGLSPHVRGIAIEGDQARAEETSVNLTVNFEFNSARLSNDGMISLDALGQALSDPALRNERFRISGHTDAVGSDSYNQKLSEARAIAVRSYLDQKFHIATGNFEAVGFGKSQLYDPADPAAAVNRRVQVTRLNK